MSRLTVGTRLWVVESGSRRDTLPTPRIVASVGRKWAVLEERYQKDRVNAEADERGRFLVDRGVYSPALARTDAQLVASEQRAALLEVRRRAAVALDAAPPETILTICRLLGIDTPDALPTEGEVLARFGALPVDRSAE